MFSGTPCIWELFADKLCFYWPCIVLQDLALKHREFQKTRGVPENTGSSRKHREFQKTRGVPENTGSSRIRREFQKTQGVPENIGSSRKHGEFQKTRGVPGNTEFQKTLGVPENIKLVDFFDICMRPYLKTRPRSRDL